MKENTLRKIYNHPDREEIISKLTLGVNAEEVHGWLSEKYAAVGDKKLIFSVKVLKQFKDEYLDIYKQMRDDFALARQAQENIIQDMQASVQNNSAYRSKLNEYIDKEIDIKTMVKNMVLAIEDRASQVFDTIQKNPNNIKLDYVLINWFNSLTMILEKYDQIINGSPDKIIQQNHINIQILDQHIGVFHKVIREVISRLDYDTSLLFVEILNEELKKLKPSTETALPIDVRLNEAKKLEEHVSNQLDMPSA
jgi:hypothetical protein